jgi:ABC-type phosphate transport system permease subunit
VTVLPLVVGFFLSIWLLAPIASELRLFHVIMRSVLATGVGMTLSFIATAIVSSLRALSFDGGLFGASFPTPFIEGGVAAVLAQSLASSLSGLVAVLPLGILAGVLAWVWLTAHPPKHQVSGMLDEV